MHFTFKDDVADSTQHVVTGYIWEESLDNELLMTNNADTTEVWVYHADVLTEKEGYSSSTGGLSGSTTHTNIGDKITYKVNYDNIGNTVAENTLLTDVLPKGECLDVDDLEANKPTGTTVKYYDANGAVIPAPAGISCAVRKFVINLGNLPAPANVVGETIGGFSGVMTDVEDLSGVRIEEKVELENLTNL